MFILYLSVSRVDMALGWAKFSMKSPFKVKFAGYL